MPEGAALRRGATNLWQPPRDGAAPFSNDANEALARLLRVHGPNGLKAALLAMMLAPGNERRLEAWFDETVGIAEAEHIRGDMQLLGPAALLPWFERVLERLAGATLAERQALLLAVRRLLTAAGPGRAIDRLLWLVARRGFGEMPWLPDAALPKSGVAELPAAALPGVAVYTAHLARMVPGEDADCPSGPDWYLDVMLNWQSAAAVPPHRRPDVDAMVRALAGLQMLSWIQRPLLVRAWVVAALKHSHADRLAPGAADALRLTCVLLDSPMPPELARHYIALPQEFSKP